ncbi:MAG: N-acetylmuramic acid 6-phosphate etherase [Candidatus Marinimicrobia bacterium]|nr:N-acetylmuramic acid 6-phosphate etherase [Candidatus Neomarinimicrobiota bacterium]MBL7022714.1 N-acetylmuramic acid 6-phosphate etherase [Candidatus Neomarinimicrobiota bacterium]MBL7109157.1 N-acetylmuramic acid 6-phosphate etherase [Candidatus Neomarinimicrobiota bacterium]
MNISKIKITNKITEQQNPNSINLDNLSINEVIKLINEEDKSVAFSVEKVLPQVTELIEKVIICLQNNGRLFYIGSGTSGRLGVLDASECPPTFSTNPEMVQGIIAGGYGALVKSIEGAEDNPKDGARTIVNNKITENDVVIGITASSNTPFVIGALEQAKQFNAVTGLIICNKPPKLDFVDVVIPVIAGPEVVTGSTRMKAGTATKMILNMITTTTMVKLNKTYGNLMVDLKASNNKLWERGTRIISYLTGLPPDEALKFLKEANGEVKTAIVMSKLQTNYNKAKQLLDNAQGSLRKVID